MSKFIVNYTCGKTTNKRGRVVDKDCKLELTNFEAAVHRTGAESVGGHANLEVGGYSLMHCANGVCTTDEDRHVMARTAESAAKRRKGRS